MYKYTWPKISEATKKAVLKQLDKGEISIYKRGGIFAEFEDAFAKYHGRKYALLFNSGTASLHAAMVGCNFQPGDEVIYPAYTFYATVTPIFQTGAVPILCDAQEDGNIDPQKIEPLITAKTKAVIVTHMWGIPCNMEAIMEICRRHGLKLIEDCSHAHGGKYQGKRLGSFGNASAFSLQGQKIISGGEGGILLTDDREVFERALLLGHYNKRCLEEIDPNAEYYRYAVTGFGLKLRAHPFAIAMAMEQFSHLDEWHQAKKDNAEYLSSRLEKIEGIRLPKPPRPGDEPSWYAYVIQVEAPRLNIPVSEFCDRLVRAGITDADKPGSTCPLNHLDLFQNPGPLYPAYEGKVSYARGGFPAAEKFHANAIKFPIDIRPDREYLSVLDDYARIIQETLRKHTA